MAREAPLVDMAMVMEKKESELTLWMTHPTWKHVPVDSRCFPKVAAMRDDVRQIEQSSDSSLVFSL